MVLTKEFELVEDIVFGNSRARQALETIRSEFESLHKAIVQLDESVLKETEFQQEARHEVEKLRRLVSSIK